MPVVFRLAAPLRPYAAGRDRVEIHGAPATVREALDALGKVHPGLRERVLSERGTVRPHVNVFVGSESIRHTGSLETPLSSSCEISLLPAVSGGAPGSILV
jgi:molybdopterin converting factor small subunit